MERDERYTIAYNEALRAVTDQQAALDALHSRAGLVASAATVVTGLIGLGATGGESLGLPALVAIITLLGILALVGMILWPWREWRFHFQASKLHWYYIEGPNPLNSLQMKRDLALHLEAYFQANARKIDLFGIMLGAAILLLFADVVAVTLEIWRR